MIDATAALRVRLVGFDVDGVMTDGGLYLGDLKGKPVEIKRYDAQDGVGIHLLRQAGIKVVIVTGRKSASVKMRATELRVDELVQDTRAHKLPALRRMLRKHGIAAAEVAFVGDDLPDLAVMRFVGLPVAVANGTREVREAAQVQLSRAGGRGAVREFAELLLAARGEWDGLVARYLAERLGGERSKAKS
ncbi:MAG TPA: HAD hydrolase family protein [Gemmatimonadaceae bacterium]|nr:HAD hydrolase family protein [Gemmatimonadaceae bacterium]